MARQKRDEVRRAILQAAYHAFAEHGYTGSNISLIAKLANVSPANVYVYYPSKLDILFAIYDPWLTRHFDALERALEKIPDPAQRLKKILATLWRDIPSAHNGFANNMMQALSTTSLREGYRPELRVAMEVRLSRMLESCLPNFETPHVRDIASILFMAFDGYILNFHLLESATCPTKRLELLVEVLLSFKDAPAAKTATKAAPRAGSDRKPRARRIAPPRARASTAKTDA